MSFLKGGVLIGNNTIDSLLFTAAYNYTIASNSTQKIIKYWLASTNNCIGLMEIFATNTTTNATATIQLFAATNAVVSNAIIKNINVSGIGTPLNVTNCYDYGFNTNINFAITTNKKYYWVGGNGNWNDATHWSAVNNGVYPSSTGCIPTPIDDVEFNVNSGFASANQKIFLDGVNHYCKNMVWYGVGNTPEIYGSRLTVSGSFTLQANKKYSVFKTYFDAKQMGQTVNCNGTILLSELNFNEQNGGWILQDEVNVMQRAISFKNGNLNTNNNTVRAESFSGKLFNNSSNLSLSLGSSQIYLINNWAYTGNLMQVLLNAGTSHIRLGSTFLSNLNHVYNDISFVNTALTGTLKGGIVANNVMFNGNSNIGDNNTVNTLTYAAGTINLLQANAQQTIKISLQGTTPACAGLSELKTTDNFFNSSMVLNQGCTYNLSAMLFSGISFQGASAPITVSNCYDFGNNAGIIFNNTIGNTYYWVGGKGNWNDATHWSTINNGVYPGINGCVPTPLDNVIFNNNSGFVTTADSVKLNGTNHYCKNFTVQNTANNPVFINEMGGQLYLYGSIVLQNGIKWNVALVNLNATTGTATINTKGAIMKSSISINGNASFELLNHITVEALDVQKSKFTTNGFNITANNVVFKNNTNLKPLRIENNTIKVNAYTSNSFTPNALFAGNSFIKCITFNASLNNTFNIITIDSIGQIAGSFFAKRVWFKNNGTIKGANTLDTLIFTAGKKYNLENAKAQQINKAWYPNGNPCFITRIESAVPGMQATIQYKGANRLFDYLYVKDISAFTNLYQFNTDSQSTDDGNNSFINFAPYNNAIGIRGFGNDTIVNCTQFPFQLPILGFYATPFSQFTWQDGSTNQQYVVQDSGTYFVTVQYGDNCSVTDTIRITRTNNAGVRNINATICSNQTYQLPSGQFVSTSGLYSDTITNAIGCDSIYKVNLFVKPAAVVTVNKRLCPSESYTLSNGQIVSASGIYTNVFPLANGCDSTIITHINVLTIDSLRISINNDTSICLGNSVQLKTNVGANFTWLPSSTLNASNIANPIATPNVTTVYTVKFTDTVCMLEHNLQTRVVVIPLPNVKIVKSNNIDCGNSSAQPSVSNLLTNIVWSPSAGLNTTSAATVIATPSVTSTYYVTAADATTMCVGKDSVIVERNIAAPNFPIPNIFTPNNDGKNDCFKILFWSEVKNFKLEIYNRW